MKRRLHEDLAFRMLGAGNFPKHHTIRDFRALHLLELSDLFVQVVKLAQEMGLVKLGTVAIDGTKIKAKAKANFTDPDSRIMKRAGGSFDASYNAQTRVDERAPIVVAAELGNNAADVGQLVPTLDAVKANTGRTPEQALADAGYRSEDNFQALAGSTIDLIVAMGRVGKRCAEVDATKNAHTAAMATKLRTDEARAAYRKRKSIAEPPNGWIKSVLGLRQFSLRGLHRVRAEFQLVCLALNLRRMGSMRTA